MDRFRALSLEFRQRGELPDFHRKEEWRGFSIEHARVARPSEYDFAWKGQSHYLAFHDIVLAEGEMDVDGMKRLPGGDLRDQLTYFPPDCSASGWAAPTNRQNSFTVLCFDPAQLCREVEIASAPSRPVVYFRDPSLRVTMLKLQTQLLNYHSSDRMLTETLGLLAALELFRVTASGELPLASARGGLSRSQEKLVRDYIDANLSMEMGLDDLAALANLSRFHFSRAFKTSIGIPPHRYIQEQRIERAKQLLLDRSLTLADVASAVGFKTDTHFSRVFNEQTRLSPGAFRRAIG